MKFYRQRTKRCQWAIFDLHENPVPSFHKGRICISGDAAHATSPHHGAGAGFCVEDSAVLATLLSHKAVKSPTDIEKVFAAFDECRRERCQWLVRSSRFMGEGYQSRAEGVGGDFKKLETEINVRNGIVADIDVYEMCTQATNVLSRLLK
jgi:salicylate hydroxylase